MHNAWQLMLCVFTTVFSHHNKKATQQIENHQIPLHCTAAEVVTTLCGKSK